MYFLVGIIQQEEKHQQLYKNNQPETYQNWLEYSLESVQDYPDGEKIVFINAWNEWAEGCHLEPD